MNNNIKYSPKDEEGFETAALSVPSDMLITDLTSKFSNGKIIIKYRERPRFEFGDVVAKEEWHGIYHSEPNPVSESYIFLRYSGNFCVIRGIDNYDYYIEDYNYDKLRKGNFDNILDVRNYLEKNNLVLDYANKEIKPNVSEHRNGSIVSAYAGKKTGMVIGILKKYDELNSSLIIDVSDGGCKEVYVDSCSIIDGISDDIAYVMCRLLNKNDLYDKIKTIL